MSEPATERLILSITRIIKAPRPRVFQAFSSVDEMKKWFGPGPCHVREGEMEFKAGGDYRLGLHTGDSGDVDLVGTYEEIVPDERLRFSWRWTNNDVIGEWGQMTVTIKLADHADGTELTVIHEGLINEQSRQEHKMGWNGSFDKLDGCV